MITLEQFFGRWLNHPDATEERKSNAVHLLECVANLEVLAMAAGIKFPDNPITQSGVSGTRYGGFRPQDCTQGAPHSAHKTGEAVDRYDPEGKIDEWLMANQDKMADCGIYAEHPSATPSWSHWSTRKPHSGARIFFP